MQMPKGFSSHFQWITQCHASSMKLGMNEGLWTPLRKPRTNVDCCTISCCSLTAPNRGAPVDLDTTQGMGRRWGRAPSSLFSAHQQVGDDSVPGPAKWPSFLPTDNPRDRPPGRGHQGHHQRRELGPGVPRHRLLCQGGRRGVQPFGGRLCPCGTVSGRDLRQGGTGGEGGQASSKLLFTYFPSPTTESLTAYGG